MPIQKRMASLVAWLYGLSSTIFCDRGKNKLNFSGFINLEDIKKKLNLDDDAVFHLLMIEALERGILEEKG
jgi:hypothetical protein